MANEKWLADARQLLIEIERIYVDHYSRSYDQCVHDIFNAMRRVVRRNAAFGFVEVVHGRWITEPGDFHSSGYPIWCSECNKLHFVHYRFTLGSLCVCKELFEKPKFCPSCGAVMEIEE